MLWANPCYHGNDIWARRGDLVAYRLVLFRILLCFWIRKRVSKRYQRCSKYYGSSNSPPIVIKLRIPIEDDILHNRTVSDFQVVIINKE